LYLLGRRVVSPRAAWIAAALLAAHPLHVVQSQQVRYPALLMLLTILAVLAFHRLLADGRGRDAAGFVAASLAAFYMNYLALGVVVFAGAWLAGSWREKLPGRRRAARSLIATGALFLPGALLLLLQAGRVPRGAIYSPMRVVGYTLLDFTYGIGFWGMPQAGSADAELAVLGLAGRPVVLIASLLPFVVLLAFGLTGREDGRWWTFPRTYLAVVLPFVWLVCLRSNLFQAKYVLPALPPFLLVIATGADRLLRRSKAAAAIVGAACAALIATGLATYYASEMPYQERYREIARYLKTHKQPGDAVLLYHGIARACVNYYLRVELGDVTVAPKRAQDDQLDREAFLERMREIEHRYRRLWVVYLYEGHRDPGRFARAWFPVQFRLAETALPPALRDRIELYTIPAPPAADTGP
jgi:NADH:ubiquinone oxidoreductase subunit 6 (subunit J)